MILSRLHLWSSVKPLFIRLRQSRRVAIDKSIPINVFFLLQVIKDILSLVYDIKPELHVNYRF